MRTRLGLFRWFGKERSQALQYLYSDIWKPYPTVIAKEADQAVHVLDRFHIMAHLSKALDELRAGEVKALKPKVYEPVLSKTRCLLLNWFRAQSLLISVSGAAEDFNAKTKLTSRKSFGLRTFHDAEIALYPTLGALPEPEFTHRLC